MHTCEEHGHYCPICEREEEKREDKRELAKMLESWNWNLSPFECAEDAHRTHFSWDEIEEAMKEFGFSDDNIWAVEDIYANI